MNSKYVVVLFYLIVVFAGCSQQIGENQNEQTDDITHPQSNSISVETISESIETDFPKFYLATFNKEKMNKQIWEVDGLNARVLYETDLLLPVAHPLVPVEIQDEVRQEIRDVQDYRELNYEEVEFERDLGSLMLSSDKRYLAFREGFEWIPIGNRQVFFSRIFVIDLQTGDEVASYVSAYSIEHPVWMKDNKTLHFGIHKAYTGFLNPLSLDVSTNRVASLDNWLGLISPDGSKIARVVPNPETQHQSIQITQLNAPNKLSQIVEYDWNRIQEILWMQTSDKLLLTDEIFVDEVAVDWGAGMNDIYLVDTISLDVTPFPKQSDLKYFRDLAWSFDGNWLAAVGKQTRGDTIEHLLVLDKDGVLHRDILFSNETLSTWQWSSEENMVLILEGYPYVSRQTIKLFDPIENVLEEVELPSVINDKLQDDLIIILSVIWLID